MPKNHHKKKYSCQREKPRNLVYDKKMLWQANLYLNVKDTISGYDKKTGEALYDDWNNVNPWNAPPGVGKVVAGGSNPVWGRSNTNDPTSWDTNWGYNEWNVFCKGNGNSWPAFQGLASLLTSSSANSPKIYGGDGKQVVELIPFTPTRSISAKTVPTDINVINNTVSYSFPNHLSEKGPGTYRGDAGSMDSPFDYNKKMQKQLNLLKNWYNSSGKMFVKSPNQWPAGVLSAEGVASASGFGSWQAFKDNVVGATNTGLLLGDNIFQAINTTPANWLSESNQNTLNQILLPWKNTYPLEHRWWKYVVNEYADWSDETWTPETDRFIPSLGLRRKWPNASLDEVKPESIISNNFLEKNWVIEAGTDCVGFAQRSASWQGNTYTWSNLNLGWTEKNGNAGMSNIWTQLESYNPGGVGERGFPLSNNDGNIILHNRSGFAENTYIKTKAADQGGVLTAEENTQLIKKLKLIMPGDIWVKDSIGDTNKDGSQNNEWDNHIAIVAEIPRTPSGFDTAEEYMNQIILIEGEFTSRIQSVIKFVRLSDYNTGTLPNNAHGGFLYPGAEIPQNGIVLNCQSWAIWRLQ
jgi:hypothetical protein